MEQSGNKRFQLTGSNAATGTKYMWQDGFETAWTNRDTGSDIVEVEVDFYTGNTTTSKNTVRLALYDSTGTKIITGLLYFPETRVFRGLAYYDNAGSLNNYTFKLGAGNTDYILTAETWYRVGFSWNSVTGEVKWKAPSVNAYVMGASVGLVPSEVDFVASAGGGFKCCSICNHV